MINVFFFFNEIIIENKKLKEKIFQSFLQLELFKKKTDFVY